MIPERDNDRNDVIDFLVDGMQDVHEVKNPDGTYSKISEFNPEIPWFKGHIINQPFGRCALYLKRTEHLAQDSFNHMSPERAVNMAQGILNHVEDYKRSIDAKSSEIFKDENNTQSALVHILSRNKVEKQYTVKGEAKKTFLDGLLGRDGESEQD